MTTTNKEWAHNGRAEELWDEIAARAGLDPNGLTLQELIREFVEIGRKEARAEMALEAVEILHKLILNTRHMEAILLGEAAQKAILTAGVSDNQPTQ